MSGPLKQLSLFTIHILFFKVNFSTLIIADANKELG